MKLSDIKDEPNYLPLKNGIIFKPIENDDDIVCKDETKPAKSREYDIKVLCLNDGFKYIISLSQSKNKKILYDLVKLSIKKGYLPIELVINKIGHGNGWYNNYDSSFLVDNSKNVSTISQKELYEQQQSSSESLKPHCDEHKNEVPTIHEATRGDSTITPKSDWESLKALNSPFLQAVARDNELLVNKIDIGLAETLYQMLVDAKASNSLYRTLIEIKEVHCEPNWNNVIEWLDSVIDSFQKSHIKQSKVVEEVKIDLSQEYIDSLMSRARILLSTDKLNELTNENRSNLIKIKEWNKTSKKYLHVNDNRIFMRLQD